MEIQDIPRSEPTALRNLYCRRNPVLGRAHAGMAVFWNIKQGYQYINMQRQSNKSAV